MFAKSTLILVSFFVSTYAYATGSTDCHYEDEKINIQINLTTGSMFGSPIVDPSKIKLQFKEACSTTYLTKEDIIGWWGFGSDLKLAAARFEDDGTEITLLVEGQYENPKVTVVKKVFPSGQAEPVVETFNGSMMCE